jgi:hypothetical protein
MVTMSGLTPFVVVVAEVLAGPAEAAAHLVHDQKRPGAFADPGHLLDVTVRRNEDATAGNDHLYDHAGYRIGKLPVYYALYLPGALHVAGRAVAAVPATVAVGRRHVQESWASGS